MRKIKTREEIEKSENSKKILVGGVLVFLMFFSTAGYALLSGGFGGSKNTKDESNYDGNYFIYNVFGKQVSFINSLESVRDIPVEINVTLDSYTGQDVYLAGKEDYVLGEIERNLGQFSGRMQKACYGSCKEDLPEKGCEDNLIVFERSDEKSVKQEGKCIFIKGDITSADAFLYKLFSL